MCHLVAWGIYIRWQHLIFVLCTVVQLYKEDWGILRMLGCRAVALPSTEQIVLKTNYVGPAPLALLPHLPAGYLPLRQDDLGLYPSNMTGLFQLNFVHCDLHTLF